MRSPMEGGGYWGESRAQVLTNPRSLKSIETNKELMFPFMFHRYEKVKLSDCVTDDIHPVYVRCFFYSIISVNWTLRCTWEMVIKYINIYNNSHLYISEEWFNQYTYVYIYIYWMNILINIYIYIYIK